jgi:hypothetical protein
MYMKLTDIEEIIWNTDKEIEGKSREEIIYLSNELSERTDGSIIDGIKIGYLYSILIRSDWGSVYVR